MEYICRFLLIPVKTMSVLCHGILGSWLLVVLAISPAVYAQLAPEIGNLRYVVDYDNSLGIDEIQTDLVKTRTEYSNLGWVYPDSTVISLGFHKEPHWFSWQINPGELTNAQRSPTNQYILEVPFPSIDHLNVWVFDQNNNLLLSDYVGDSQPFSARQIPSRKFLFQLGWDTKSELTVIMRVQTTDTVRFDSQIWPAEKFWTVEEQHTLSHGIYIGVIAAMFFLYISLAFGVRERSFFYYTLWLPFMSIAIITDLGYGFEYLWPNSIEWNNRAYPFFTCLGASIGVLFLGDVLSINSKTNPVQNLVFRSVTALGLLSSIACLLIPNFYTLQLTTLTGIAIITALAFVVIPRVHTADTQTSLLLIAITIVGSVGVIRILNNFGLVASIPNIEYYLETGTAVEVILLSIFLAARIYNDRRKRYEAQQNLIALQKTMYNDLEKIVEERTQELQSLNKLLEETSVTDPLTGLKNRRYFDENIDKLISYASRADKGVGIMMIDLDHFKQINDNHGHQVGDECLSHFSDILRSIIKRDTDIVARYGGEEFIVALANCDRMETIKKAEMIRSELGKLPLVSNNLQIELSCSIGVAHEKATKNICADLMIKEADAALYQAKDAGRNRVQMLQDWEQKPGTSAA